MPAHRPPLTDSPWFWVLAFSLMALGALAAINGKYGRRQAAIERQFQARERVARQNREAAAGTEQPAPPNYATPGDTLIPLWPLALIMLAVATLALAMLIRSRRPDGSVEVASPP